MAWKRNNASWHPEGYQRLFARKVNGNIARAAIYLTNDIENAFPPSGAIGTRSGGGDPKNTSKPGGIPHVQSSLLQTSIQEQLYPLRFMAKVGSTLRPEDTKSGKRSEHSYALWLELGTERMRGPRPYLRPALARNRQRLREMIAR